MLPAVETKNSASTGTAISLIQETLPAAEEMSDLS
jgi:hypothetical protein